LEYSISDLQAKLAEEQQSHSQAVVHLKEGEKNERRDIKRLQAAKTRNH